MIRTELETVRTTGRAAQGVRIMESEAWRPVGRDDSDIIEGIGCCHSSG